MVTRLVMPPGANALPVTLARAKQHLNVDVPDDDDLIQAYILAAGARVEQLGRALVLLSSTWAVDMDAFDDPIILPRVPAVAVTGISYFDEDGDAQTVSPSDYAYTIDAAGFGRVRPVYGSRWPGLRGDFDDVSVTFTAGYAAGQVPTALQAAVLLIVGGLYEQRADVTSRAVFEVPGAVENLVAPFRVWL